MAHSNSLQNAPKETQDYINKHQIPQLFECLMTGLMYHKPVDYLQYLQSCLDAIKHRGTSSIHWDLFLCGKESNEGTLVKEESTDIIVKETKLLIEPGKPIICIVYSPAARISEYGSFILNKYPRFARICLFDAIIKMGNNIEDLLKQSEEENVINTTQKAFESHLNGDMIANEFMFELLVQLMNEKKHFDGFVILNYPMSLIQYEMLKTAVGDNNPLQIIMIDSTEDLKNQTLKALKSEEAKEIFEKRIQNFEEITISGLKIIESLGDLKIVDGSSSIADQQTQILTIFEEILSDTVKYNILEKTLKAHEINEMVMIPDIGQISADEGRKKDLPECPIILLLGGPGSGRSTQLKCLFSKIPTVRIFDVNEFLRSKVIRKKVEAIRLLRKQGLKCTLEENVLSDWEVHAKRTFGRNPPTYVDRIMPENWSIHVDVLREEIVRIGKQADAILIEGYPTNVEQLNTLNETIGGINYAVLLDCEEQTMIDHIEARYERVRNMRDEPPVLKERVEFFKKFTLSIARHYDELGKLLIIPGDRSLDFINDDLTAFMELMLRKDKMVKAKEDEIRLGEEEPVSDPREWLKEKRVIIIHGPPALGRSRLAKLLADPLDAHLVDARNIEKQQFFDHMADAMVQNTNSTVIVYGFGPEFSHWCEFENELANVDAIILLEEPDNRQKVEVDKCGEFNEYDKIKCATEKYFRTRRVTILKVDISRNMQDISHELIALLSKSF